MSGDEPGEPEVRGASRYDFWWLRLRDGPDTPPGEEHGPDDADLARFAAVFAAPAPPEAVHAGLLADPALRKTATWLGTGDGATASWITPGYAQVWPRVQGRWGLVETGLAVVARGKGERRPLRFIVAEEDTYRYFFNCEPEERDALYELYCSLVDNLPWPAGFGRGELAMTFMIE